MIDTLSPHGPTGPMEVQARGCDVAAADGTVTVIADAACEVRLERRRRKIVSLSTGPGIAGI